MIVQAFQAFSILAATVMAAFCVFIFPKANGTRVFIVEHFVFGVLTLGIAVDSFLHRETLHIMAGRLIFELIVLVTLMWACLRNHAES